MLEGEDVGHGRIVHDARQLRIPRAGHARQRGALLGAGSQASTTARVERTKASHCARSIGGASRVRGGRRAGCRARARCGAARSGALVGAASTSAAIVHRSANASSAREVAGGARRPRLADSTNSPISTRSSLRTGSAAGASQRHWPEDAVVGQRAREPAHVDARSDPPPATSSRTDAREREAALEERVGDRLDQRLARREVAVDRADADARAARDVLHAERRAVARVLVDGGLEHALAVAGRVDALAAHRRCSPIARPASAGAMMLGSPVELVELVALARALARSVRARRDEAPRRRRRPTSATAEHDERELVAVLGRQRAARRSSAAMTEATIWLPIAPPIVRTLAFMPVATPVWLGGHRLDDEVRHRREREADAEPDERHARRRSSTRCHARPSGRACRAR